MADSGNPNENIPSTDTGVNSEATTSGHEVTASYDASAITGAVLCVDGAASAAI